MHLPAITLACAGHVLIDLPVFGGPVAMLVGWVLYMVRRERAGEVEDEVEPRGTEAGALTGTSALALPHPGR